jgi:epoxyqueuosine reductase
MTAAEIRQMAQACGFELAGVAAAGPSPDAARYHRWVAAGFAGEMAYLEGHRAGLRDDPRRLLPSARSVIAVGKLYNTPWPHSTAMRDPERAWISRYAWGEDYHDVLRRGLERLLAMLRERAGAPFEAKLCVDTAPLAERSWARQAGLGWIGKNTCLIHQGAGSWFFLGALVVSLELETGAPPPDRCGSCRRCIDACPTSAIVPAPGGGGWALDSRACLSYHTIELRGTVPVEWRAAAGAQVFGCDICQDVCPWNRRAPVDSGSEFAPRHFAPPLEDLAALDEPAFRAMFRGTQVTRAKHRGLLRSVAVAMGSLALARFRGPLERLAASVDPLTAEHARWALMRLP